MAEKEPITDNELIERLIMIQRRIGEEPEDIRASLADILETALTMKDIPPVRFTLLTCILLGQEEGLCFVRSKIPSLVYDSIFSNGLNTMTQ